MRVNLKYLSLLVLILFSLSCSGKGTSGNPNLDLTSLQYLEHFVIKTDGDGDGVFDEQNTYYLNQNNRITHRDVDFDFDGVVDGTEDFIYDENGNNTKSVYDLPTNKLTNTLTYDENGNQINHDVDSGNDGVIDATYHSLYNLQNRRTDLQNDNGNDGVVDILYRNIYDATGLINVRNETFINDFGILKLVYVEERGNFNAQGLAEKLSIDTNGDGTFNNVSTYTYNENGQMLTSSSDAGNDLVIDFNVFYTYASDGKLLKIEFDTNGDGTIDNYTEYDYSLLPTIFTTGNLSKIFDPEDVVNGFVVSHSRDFLGGVLISANLTTYAEDGSESYKEIDKNGDGIIDRVDGSKYDDRGSLSEYYEDTDNDGAYDYHEVYENFYADLPN